jgi:hypothetical protein
VVEVAAANKMEVDVAQVTNSRSHGPPAHHEGRGWEAERFRSSAKEIAKVKKKERIPIGVAAANDDDGGDGDGDGQAGHVLRDESFSLKEDLAVKADDAVVGGGVSEFRQKNGKLGDGHCARIELTRSAVAAL